MSSWKSSTSPTKPKRSLLFVWHAGEEKGLWGSEYFTDHPTMPRDSIVAQLNRTVNEILAMPSIEKQMIAQGADPVGGTPAEFGQFVQREYEKWKLVVRESGATAE